MTRTGTYATLYRITLNQALAYRAHFLISLLTSPIFLGIQYFVWKEILSRPGNSGYTLAGIVSYFIISYIVGHFIYDNTHKKMERYVVKGELNQVLLKPYALVGRFFTEKLASRTFALITESVPVFIIAALIFGPASIALAGTVWTVAAGIAVAFTLSFLTNYLFGMLGFWTTKTHGFRLLRMPIDFLLGGMLFPLDIAPAWAQKILFFLPFQHFMYAPAKYWAGDYRLAGVTDPLIALLYGAFWILVLFVAAIWLQKRAYEKYQGVGQ